MIQFLKSFSHGCAQHEDVGWVRVLMSKGNYPSAWICGQPCTLGNLAACAHVIICCFERTIKGRQSTQPAFSWFPGPNCARATSPILLQPYTAVPSHCNFSNVKQFLKAISKSICPHNLSFTPKNISKTKQTMHICIKFNRRI